MKRIGVLVSGNGSNLQAIIDASQSNNFQGNVVCVISNRPNAFALERAKSAAIDAYVIDHLTFSERQKFDAAMIELIDRYQVDFVILAGFMRILSAQFIQHYAGRLFNIHPSLLPKFKGLNTHERVINANEIEHGCSVHLVTEELDDGPVVLQAKVKISVGETPSELQKRIHQLEHRIYPKAIDWLCTERLTVKNNQVFFDRKLLISPHCETYTGLGNNDFN